MITTQNKSVRSQQQQTRTSVSGVKNSFKLTNQGESCWKYDETKLTPSKEGLVDEEEVAQHANQQYPTPSTPTTTYITRPVKVLQHKGSKTVSEGIVLPKSAFFVPVDNRCKVQSIKKSGRLKLISKTMMAATKSTTETTTTAAHPSLDENTSFALAALLELSKAQQPTRHVLRRHSETPPISQLSTFKSADSTTNMDINAPPSKKTKRSASLGTQAVVTASTLTAVTKPKSASPPPQVVPRWSPTSSTQGLRGYPQQKDNNDTTRPSSSTSTSSSKSSESRERITTILSTLDPVTLFPRAVERLRKELTSRVGNMRIEQDSSKIMPFALVLAGLAATQLQSFLLTVFKRIWDIVFQCDEALGEGSRHEKLCKSLHVALNPVLWSADWMSVVQTISQQSQISMTGNNFEEYCMDTLEIVLDDLSRSILRFRLETVLKASVSQKRTESADVAKLERRLSSTSFNSKNRSSSSNDVKPKDNNSSRNNQDITSVPNLLMAQELRIARQYVSENYNSTNEAIKRECSYRRIIVDLIEEWTTTHNDGSLTCSPMLLNFFHELSHQFSLLSAMEQKCTSKHTVKALVCKEKLKAQWKALLSVSTESKELPAAMKIRILVRLTCQYLSAQIRLSEQKELRQQHRIRQQPPQHHQVNKYRAMKKLKQSLRQRCAATLHRKPLVA